MAKKKRNMMAEVVFAATSTGFDKVKSSITSATDTMRQAQKVYAGNVSAFEVLGRANMSYAAGLDANQKAVLNNQYTYDHYAKAVRAAADGQTSLSDITADQMKQYGQLGTSIDDLLKRHREDNILTEEQVKQYGDLRDGVSRVSQTYGAYEQNLAKINEKTQKAKTGFDGLFGSLKMGSTEANEGFALMKRGFDAFIKPFVNPVVDKAKQNLAELMARKSSGALDSAASQLSGKFAAMGKKGGMSDGDGIDINSIKNTQNLLKVTKKLGGARGKDLKISGKMNKALKTTAGSTKGAASGIGNMTKSLGGATRGAQGASSAMSAFGAAGGVAAGAAAAAFVAAAAIILVVLAGVMKGLQMNVDMMENYRESAHRTNGSIEELSSSTFRLSGELGVTGEKARAAVHALGAAGLGVKGMGDAVKMANGEMLKGQDALKELSRQNIMFAHTTGASSAATAEYQMQLNQLGVTGEKQSAILGMLTGASEAYGLSGAQLDKVTNTLTKSLKKQRALFSSTKPKEYAGAVAGLAGAAREAKVDLDGVLEFVENMNDLTSSSTVMLLAYGGALNEAFKVDGDQTKILEGGLRGAMKVMQDFEGAGALIQQRMYKRFGINEDMQNLYKTKLKGLVGAEREAMMQSMLVSKQKEATQKESYDKSMATLTQSWNQLMGEIMPVIAEAVAPLAKDLAAWFKSMRPMMKKTIIPAIKTVFKVAGSVLGVFVKIATALGPVGSLLSMLSPPLAAVWFVVKKIASAFGLTDSKDDMFGVSKGIKKASGPLATFKKILFAILNPIGLIIEGMQKISDWWSGQKEGGLKPKRADGMSDDERKAAAARAKLRIAGQKEKIGVNQVGQKALMERFSKPSLQDKIGVESKARSVTYAKDKKRDKKDAVPVYTVQFGKDTASDRDIRMLNRLGTMAAHMKELVEKRDPDNARTADALEQMHVHQKKPKPKERRSRRLQQGSGEAMKDWVS
tara:strand:+ start:19143 stop:22052 length:2910 start_codon:yes stop_codon:yes gene_type:complete